METQIIDSAFHSPTPYQAIIEPADLIITTTKSTHTPRGLHKWEFTVTSTHPLFPNTFDRLKQCNFLRGDHEFHVTLRGVTPFQYTRKGQFDFEDELIEGTLYFYTVTGMTDSSG